jgi:hypothetical protein
MSDVVDELRLLLLADPLAWKLTSKGGDVNRACYGHTSGIEIYLDDNDDQPWTTSLIERKGLSFVERWRLRRAMREHERLRASLAVAAALAGEAVPDAVIGDPGPHADVIPIDRARSA